MPSPVSQVGGTPSRVFKRTVSMLALGLGLAQMATAQSVPVLPVPPVSGGSSDIVLALAKVDNSKLDAALFYQLLIGEIELRAGAPGEAYQVILDAARRSKDEQLFRRAVDIAVQARAGDQALAAVKAWRLAAPESVDAMRYHEQLLVPLNRVPEVVEPMQALLQRAPVAQRVELILALPRFLARSADHVQAANVVEQVLTPYLGAPQTHVAALVSMARSWLAASDRVRALALTQRAHQLDPRAEAPAALAIEQLFDSPPADAVVLSHLAAAPNSHGVRLLYVRALLTAQRIADATAQLDTLTRNSPQLAPAWLTLGALHVQLREPAPAIAALQKYIELVQAGPDVAANAGGAGEPVEGAETAEAAEMDDADSAAGAAQAPVASKEDALTRGWLLLSQAADLQGDAAGAQAWLSQIKDPARALDVQLRRAALLARAGQVAQARDIVAQLPQATPEQARARALAEAQVLREAKLWAQANAVFAQLNQRFPNDVELIYEQSMMLEKLDQLDEMERLLRRVIELKPDHQHAYNALGYSLAARNVRLPEARTLIRRALELSPGEPSITDSLGWVEFRLGNPAEALRLLRDAYKAHPDAEIGAHLGEVLWINGETEEARRVLRESQRRDSANEVLREVLSRLRIDL